MLSKALLFLGSLVVLETVHAAPSETKRPFFNNRDFSGLEYVVLKPTPITEVCRYEADGVLYVKGSPKGYLASRDSYRNFVMHAEWRWPADAVKNSNSGVLIHIASGPKDREWPLCFQIQTKPGRAGDLLPMAGASFAERLSTPPGAKTPQLDRREPSSEKLLGEWNMCDVICRDGTLSIAINGVKQNEVTHMSPAEGRVGFQLEGTPYELRNVWIEPLP